MSHHLTTRQGLALNTVLSLDSPATLPAGDAYDHLLPEAGSFLADAESAPAGATERPLDGMPLPPQDGCSCAPPVDVPLQPGGSLAEGSSAKPALMLSPQPVQAAGWDREQPGNSALLQLPGWQPPTILAQHPPGAVDPTFGYVTRTTGMFDDGGDGAGEERPSCHDRQPRAGRFQSPVLPCDLRVLSFTEWLVGWLVNWLVY